MGEPAKVISVSAPNIKKALEAQRAYFGTGATRPVDTRLAQLDKLSEGLKRNEAELLEALRKDLGKHPVEGLLSEIVLAQQDIAHTRSQLRDWVRPRPVSTPIAIQPGSSEVLLEPKGVALVIGPWNYPFQLTITPMIAAIAAGNTVILKPSELAPETSRAVAKLIRECFDPAYVTVIEGGVEASNALLDEPFDHIFFTGGTAVGRIVMEKAARHLTPVTLELGGKSPAFVTRHANLDWAAKRIAWAKFLNAGQTCTAPDYVLVDKAVAEAFVEKLKAQIRALYGSGDIAENEDYGRIVNTRHWQRLQGYLSHGRVVFGGKASEAERFFEPTLLRDVALDSPLMQEEIFGPILPIVEVDNTEAALKVSQRLSHPLAMYVFSTKRSEVEMLLSRQTSGGVSVNDCVMHMVSTELPFGGVGASGMGAYHGKAGIEEFSHKRSVLRRSLPLDLPLLKPPYKGNMTKVKRLVGLLLRFFY